MADADLSTVEYETLRMRYREERERRERASTRQYRDVADGLGRLVADPYTTTLPRAPLTDSVDVLIVGGGFGGLLTAARLR